MTDILCENHKNFVFARTTIEINKLALKLNKILEC